MPSNFSNIPHDWLSDLSPVFAAQEAWDSGTYNEMALFHVRYDSQGPFYIASGAGLLAEHVRRFRFSPDIIQRLGQVTDARGCSMLHESFLNFLQRMRLRVQVSAAPEGTLLLPGEPLLIAKGPLAQLLLMESAFRRLFWESTYWATQAALSRWEKGDWVEEDTPATPNYPFNPDGWKIRSAYIGGAMAEDILENVEKPAPVPGEHDGATKVWQESSGAVEAHVPMIQIRRLFKGNQPLADVWLTEVQEEAASVSKTNATFLDETTQRSHAMQFTRFQNLYQPVLVKGHPVLAAPRLGYFRQRTLKQMEAFHKAHLGKYPHGWYE